MSDEQREREREHAAALARLEAGRRRAAAGGAGVAMERPALHTATWLSTGGSAGARAGHGEVEVRKTGYFHTTRSDLGAGALRRRGEWFCCVEWGAPNSQPFGNYVDFAICKIAPGGAP